MRKLYIPEVNDLIESGRGTTNIILSAPHGGNIKPSDIPRRLYGTKVRDTFTKSILLEVLKLFNYKPYYIYADIHRSRVDLNRPIEEGAQEDEKAQYIWNLWNFNLLEYKKEILEKFSTGLLIDIHSHNNSNEFEIGYNLSAEGFRELLEHKTTEHKTSIDGIIPSHEVKYDAIFGEGSIYKTLNEFGFDMFIPQPKENYFNGGYNIEKYSGENFGAIQIEVPVSIAKSSLDKVSEVIMESIVNFSKEYVKIL